MNRTLATVAAALFTLSLPAAAQMFDPAQLHAYKPDVKIQGAIRV